jgi:hypothetical protein
MDHGEKDPPCSTCRVDLLPENEDTARIFQTVRGQVLLQARFTEQGMPYSVPCDLNQPAVWAAIDGYGIKDRVGTFERVLVAWHAIRRERRNDEG